jgi:hypothetical protein
MQIEKRNTDYSQLVLQISETFEQGQQQAILAVNSQLVETYWMIGQYIVEFEQSGSHRAVYGEKLIENLSHDLSTLHKKGFSISNVKRMRQFYQIFPICAELPHKLTWTHCVELLKIDDPLERGFYLRQTMHNIGSRLFVSKYQLYLPDKETLKAIIEKQINLTNE